MLCREAVVAEPCDGVGETGFVIGLVEGWADDLRTGSSNTLRMTTLGSSALPTASADRVLGASSSSVRPDETEIPASPKPVAGTFSSLYSGSAMKLLGLATTW
jgi:hypothetical protein